ncbi:MAG: rane-bound serine protease [Deltaproteobacteria bacterium]|nr:rane-bound serine protease [Deltaproteobacteria bacterium]
MNKLRTTSMFITLLFLFPCMVLGNDVYTIKVQGTINPPMASFVTESIVKAEKNGSEALLILMDTPGGLDTSMRDIIKGIMESSIPVIVYVYPSGARAASAGSVILLASHIAAMAPGTNAGAAHPVSVGQEKADKVMMEKVAKDAEAYVRSIAKQRGRNEEWAAKSVKESASITATDAVDNKVADLVAASIDELLEKIDGKKVETKKGKVVLKTKGKKAAEVVIPFKYKFLSYISDPNVAYILMMIGMYGILFEIYSPGTIFPGVVGGICLILALYSFQTLPISYAGLFLILLGVIFFILELKIVSHGALGIAGLISLVIGSIMLIDLPSSILSISYTTIIIVAVLTGIFFFGVLSYAIKAQLFKVTTGKEGLVGEEGMAQTDIFHEGKVFVHGEIWNGKSDELISEGEKVIVTAVEGLVLTVKRKGG